MRTVQGSAVCGAAFLLITGLASAQAQYRLTDFGSYSEVAAINGAGEVTGVAGAHAFLWDGTTVRDLGTLGGSYSYGLAINATGQVAGASRYQAGNLDFHAFLFDGATMRDLGTLGGTRSQGVAINASAQVTGWSYPAGSTTRRAFLWDGTTMQDLGTLGGASSTGVAINASGQVTGSATYSSGSSLTQAFVWDGTSMLQLSLGGSSGWGTAINDAGQVTGTSNPPGDGAQRAFIWDGTMMRDLGTLGGCCSIGTDINATGQVTGSASTADGDQHAFLWDGTSIRDVGTLYRAGETFAQSRAFVWDGAVMRDLNSLIDSATPLPPDFVLSSGEDINDHGQIIAFGCNTVTFECRGFLLSPVSSPAEMIAALLQKLTGVGPGNSLKDKMTLVQTYYAADDIPATCAMLTDFVSQVRAQSGKRAFTTEQASELIADAQAIMAAIGCN